MPNNSDSSAVEDTAHLSLSHVCSLQILTRYDWVFFSFFFHLVLCAPMEYFVQILCGCDSYVAAKRRKERADQHLKCERVASRQGVPYIT